VEFFTERSLAGNPATLTLQIAPRRPLEDPPAGIDPLENLQFYASKISFESRLLHDVDALRLVDRFKRVTGATIFRQCLIKRAPDGAGSDRPYLLSMNCEGDLITLDVPPASPGAPQ
jgi:hypothetical protein